MSVQIGRLAKSRIVRDLNGQIIDWFDETQGGWIVQKRQIVNTELWNKHIQKENDKREAAKAITMQKVDPNAPDRTAAPNKMEALEKRIDSQDAKLDAILAALKK